MLAKNLYQDNDVNIPAKTYKNDFDRVGWEPIVTYYGEDYDEDAKEKYGYK